MKKIILFLLLSFSMNAQYQVEFFNTNNSAIPINNIVRLEVDNANNLWFTGYSSAANWVGLIKKSGSNYTVYNTSNSGIASNDISNIRIDPFGNAWMRNFNGVLSKFDGTSWSVYNAGIYDFTFSSNGDLWAIAGNKIKKYNGITWTEFNPGSFSPITYFSQPTIGANELGYVFIFNDTPFETQILIFDGTTWSYKTINDSAYFIKAKQNKVYFTSSDTGNVYSLDVATDVLTNLSQTCATESCYAVDIDLDSNGKVWTTKSYCNISSTNSILNINDCLLFNNSTYSSYPPYTDFKNIIIDSQNTVWGASSDGLVKISNTGVLDNEDVSLKNKISISPNPAQDEIYVKSNESIKEIQILNTEGKLIKKINQNFEKIEVKNLAKGMYILKITTEKGTYSEKFLKK